MRGGNVLNKVGCAEGGEPLGHLLHGRKELILDNPRWFQKQAEHCMAGQIKSKKRPPLLKIV